MCYAATPDALPSHCSPFIGPVKPAIPPADFAGLRWSVGSTLYGAPRDEVGPLAVNDEIQIRGGPGVRNQPFGTRWQRSTSAQIPAQPADVETFLYLSHPARWANPDIQALPAEQGLGASRRYITADDVGRLVRG